MKASLPANEAERLLRLHGYGLLDTPVEEAHERIVRMAKHIFAVPMVAISLVDEDRQWLKASCGMPDREVKRDYSFCAHTILDVEVFVVRDTQKDPRFVDNPQVVGPPHLRFYAGAPLKTPDGYHLGSFCVLDAVPRRFTVADGHMLADLAAIVMDEFALRRTVLRLREESDNLINEVLDISRIESGHVEFFLESIVVADVVAETLDLIRPLANARQIILESLAGLEEGEEVIADRRRFRQVLLKLFSNAVKYSAPGGRVTVSCVPGIPGHRRICIKDEGTGIPAEKLGRLFIPFERLGAEHSEVPGTGLGLALSKHLAKALHGTIGVESQPGKGSTFWLELPVATPPQEERTTADDFHQAKNRNGKV